ncbi:hypothetical protein K1719_028384 [Acacia pycnantha]|nr:hypothetical protein K1719_028384 [Acacia pycnantha]
MSVEMVDAATILKFVEDEEAFDASVRDMFGELDKDKDGFLSYDEMVNEFKRLRKPMKMLVFMIHCSCSSIMTWMEKSICMREFKQERKKMMIVIADGIGFLPLQMVLEPDSLILKAVQIKERL